jgi:hypothetical protein
MSLSTGGLVPNNPSNPSTPNSGGGGSFSVTPNQNPSNPNDLNSVIQNAPAPDYNRNQNLSIGYDPSNPEGLSQSQPVPGASTLAGGINSNFDSPAFNINETIPIEEGPTSATKSDSGGGSAKRKVECPYCKGEVLSEKNGRTSSSMTLFPRLQNVLFALIDLINVFLGGAIKVSKQDALGGECRTCGNSKEIEDATDTASQDAAAANYLKGKAGRILALERKLGNSPGGNMLTRVAGAKIEIVGRTFNSAQSYTVHKGKGINQARAVVKEKGRGGVQEGPEKDKGPNVVTGNNVPSNTGGGLYYIQCANKFKLAAGAQGIDGGIVRFTGAEVAIGSSVGTTLVEGDHLQFTSKKSISMTPEGEGFVNINGSFSASGNLQAGGGYIDNLYAANMTMPERQETTKIASGTTDILTGPAVWGGPVIPTLQVDAVKNFLKWVLDSSTDMVLAGAMNPLNPRAILKIKDNATSILYSQLPLELKPTGVATILYGTSIGIHPIINFPHEHSVPDSVHSHNMTVPAINHKGHTAESVRAEADGAGINSKVPAAHGGGGADIITKILGGVGALASAVGQFFVGGQYKV